MHSMAVFFVTFIGTFVGTLLGGAIGWFIFGPLVLRLLRRRSK